MSRRILTALLFLTASTSMFQANATESDGSDAYVYADVVEVTPVIEIVREPVYREVCREVEVKRRRSATPPIVGGIVGALIGNQFGSGSGRTAATVAGGALGASVAADRQRRKSDSVDIEHRCQRVREYREYERVVGYRVSYRYDGEIRTATTRKHPGEQLRLQLSVDG